MGNASRETQQRLKPCFALLRFSLSTQGGSSPLGTICFSQIVCGELLRTPAYKQGPKPELNRS